MEIILPCKYGKLLHHPIQHQHLKPFLFPLKFYRTPKGGHLYSSFQGIGYGTGDVDGFFGGVSFKAGGGVYGVADGGVVHALGRSDISDNRLPHMDADPKGYRSPIPLHQFFREGF